MGCKLKITVLVDAATVPGDDPQFESRQDKSQTEYDVIESLRSIGYDVSVVPAIDNVGALVEKLTEHKAELVFNLTEEFNGDRRMDQGIASLLELLGLSFTPQHSDARVLEQLIYKWRHTRVVLAQVLTEQYAALAAAGRPPTAAEIAADAAELLGGGAERFLRG